MSYPRRLAEGGVDVVVAVQIGVQSPPDDFGHGRMAALRKLVDASPLLVGEVDLGSLCHIQRLVYSVLSGVRWTSHPAKGKIMIKTILMVIGAIVVILFIMQALG